MFIFTEHHAKLSLEILATMSQVCKVIQDLLSWIIESIDLKKDLASYGGTSSPGERTPTDSVDHVDTVLQQIISDLESGSSWLMDTFSRVRDGIDLVTNGLFSSMEYNASTLIASKHHAPSVVLKSFHSRS